MKFSLIQVTEEQWFSKCLQNEFARCVNPLSSQLHYSTTLIQPAFHISFQDSEWIKQKKPIWSHINYMQKNSKTTRSLKKPTNMHENSTQTANECEKNSPPTNSPQLKKSSIDQASLEKQVVGKEGHEGKKLHTTCLSKSKPSPPLSTKKESLQPATYHFFLLAVHSVTS